MTVLIYMPFYESKGRGVFEAQKDAWAWFHRLMQDYELKLSILNEYDVKFMLRSTTGASEDRLPFIASIWDKYDLIMIESTKIPTMQQLKALIDCKYGLCSQNYLTNIMLRGGETFKFPAHKNYTDRQLPIKQGCAMSDLNGHQIYLEYCDDNAVMADVSDLGIIKISKAFQSLNPNPQFPLEAQEGQYNTVERLHKWLRTTKDPDIIDGYEDDAYIEDKTYKWHRHKDLAKRNGLYHHRNYLQGSEYLTEQEMRALIR